MSQPVIPPINPLAAIQPAATNVTGQPIINTVPNIPIGIMIAGYVINRDAANNPIVRTPGGDVTVPSNFFIKTGSEVVFQNITGPNAGLRIVSIDRLTPAAYVAQTPRPATGDTITHPEIEQQPATGITPRAAVQAVTLPVLQSVVLQANPNAPTQTPALLQQLQAGTPITLTLHDVELPAVPLLPNAQPQTQARTIAQFMPAAQAQAPTSGAATAALAATVNAALTSGNTAYAQSAFALGVSPVLTGAIMQPAKLPNQSAPLPNQPTPPDAEGEQQPATMQPSIKPQLPNMPVTAAPVASSPATPTPPTLQANTTPLSVASPALTPQAQPPSGTPQTVATPLSATPQTVPSAPTPAPTITIHPVPTPTPQPATTQAVAPQAAPPQPAPSQTISQQPATIPPNPNQTFHATVIGHGEDGFNILQTSFATLKLYTTQPLPAGTHLQVKAEVATPQTPAIMTAFTDLAARLTMPKDFAYFGPALAQAQAQNPSIAADITQQLPVIGTKLTSGLLFFLTAVKNGEVKDLFNPRGARALEALSPGTLAHFTRDVAELNETFVNSPLNEWKGIPLPLIFNNEMQHAKLYIRDESGNNAASVDSAGQRFVLDVNFSELGTLQFDGFLRNSSGTKSFELYLRSGDPLDSSISQNIRHIFENTTETAGITGNIIFQHGVEHFMKPQLKSIGPEGTDGARTILA